MLPVVIYGAVVPAAVAAGAALLLVRLLPQAMATRYALVTALAAGIWAGYVLLPDGLPWRPEAFWHYVPHLAVPAALAGAICGAVGVSAIERLFVKAAVAGLAAWLLFPTWRDLEAVRLRGSALLAVYLLCLAWAYSRLAHRMPTRQWLALLMIAAILQTVAISASQSLTLGQLSLLITGSLAGGWLASLAEPRVAAVTATLFCAVLLGGAAFVTYIYPRPPLTTLLLFPVAPLASALTLVGPLARGNPRRVITLRMLATAVAAGAACAWVLL